MQLIKSHYEKHELTKLAYYCIAFENVTYYGNNFIFQKGYSRAFISTHSGKFNKSEINEKAVRSFTSTRSSIYNAS